MSQPDVSVVIAAYNVSQCIGRAIDSVLTQSLQSFEIVIVDDKSTDDTCEFVRKRISGDNRIRLFEQPTNQGPAAARNRGIEEAHGSWIAVLDADDAFNPQRLQALVDIGRDTGAAMVADNLFLFDAAANVITGTAMPSVLDVKSTKVVDLEDYLRNCITGKAPFDYGQFKAVMRRDFLIDNRLRYPKSLRHGEDFMLYTEILLAGGRFVLVEQAYYIFTERTGTASDRPSPHSRTVISLEDMREHTLALLSRPAVAKRPVIVSLLKQRAAAIRWHESRSIVTALARSRDRIGLIKRATSNWRVGAVVLGRALARITGGRA